MRWYPSRSSAFSSLRSPRTVSWFASIWMSTSFASTSGSSTLRVIASAFSNTSTAGVHAAVRPLSSRGAYASPNVLKRWSCKRNRSRNGSYRVMAMAMPPLNFEKRKPLLRAGFSGARCRSGRALARPSCDEANVTSARGRSRAAGAAPHLQQRRRARRPLAALAARLRPGRTRVRQVLDQPARHPSLGHHRGERVLLVSPAGAAHPLQLLLRRPHQPVRGRVHRGVRIGRRLLDLDGARPRHVQRQVALLVHPALAAVHVAQLDPQLGRLVVVEAVERLDDVLARVALEALRQAQVLSLDDDLHGGQSGAASKQVQRSPHPVIDRPWAPCYGTASFAPPERAKSRV